MSGYQRKIRLKTSGCLGVKSKRATTGQKSKSERIEPLVWSNRNSNWLFRVKLKINRCKLAQRIVNYLLKKTEFDAGHWRIMELKLLNFNQLAADGIRLSIHHWRKWSDWWWAQWRIGFLHFRFPFLLALLLHDRTARMVRTKDTKTEILGSILFDVYLFEFNWIDPLLENCWILPKNGNEKQKSSEIDVIIILWITQWC